MANILVTRFSAFGDVAMLVPVVYSAAKAYPSDVFFVCTSKSFCGLFEGLLPNLRTIPVDLKDYKGFGGLFRLAGELKKTPIDALADVHDVLRTKFLRGYFFFRGKKVRHINKGRSEKRAIVSHKKPIRPLKHSTERYREVFSALGYPFEISFVSLFNHKPENVFLPHFIPFDPTCKNIGVAPFAKHREKTYPPHLMERVVWQLSQRPEMRVYLFGGKADAEILESWSRKYPHVISVAGKTDIETELNLMHRLDAMVSMDSANMHLASLVATPVVSVWGATHPALGFYGFNQLAGNAVQIDLDCRPCSIFGDRPCHRGDWACMYGIAPETIVAKVMGALAQKS